MQAKWLVCSVAVLGLVGCSEAAEDRSWGGSNNSGDYSTDGASATPGEDASNNSTDGSGPDIEPGQLTAGEWSDLDNWSFWLGLMDEDYKDLLATWGFEPMVHVPVVVTDVDGDPAIDVPVQLVDDMGGVLWESRTNNLGEATLFPALWQARDVSYSVRVDQTSTTPTSGTPAQPIALSLPADIAKPSDVDIMFVVDVTGSMTDELGYLQVEMADVLSRVTNSFQDIDLRASFNFYCDPNDEFLVRSHPFAAPADALADLRSAPICGGGDYPEAVDEGLEDAIDNHQWSTSARARLLFLVLDAPPHDDQDGIVRLRRVTEAAAKKGVRVVPIASSGADKNTEFLLRALAMSTDSSYVFLTDDSGIGDSHIEPTIGEYQVFKLNKLLIAIISRFVQ